ncbi:helix-turn-helix domain-containing protein [Streptomyces sp. NPDC086777]|uniref:helix-turn-helix domain-containing protein n=1 Tax=Streptomyces sp. NPDC086777 TaxID=3154866 RepID=UPI00344BFD15
MIANLTGKVDISFPDQGKSVEAGGTTSTLGPLTVATVRSNARSVERTGSFTKDDLEPAIFVGLQIHGFSTVIQQDRQATLRPGDLIFYESTEPYRVEDAKGIRQHFFRIPVGRLALSPAVFSKNSATVLSPGHPITQLTADHLRRLATGHADFQGTSAEAVGQPSIDLLRAVIATHIDATQITNASLQETLLVRILEYVRAHLSEPGLNAAQVAAEHHISLRHLYKILAANGISLADWIRTHRLEECRAELSSTGSRSSTIETVARRWGFSDMSSFSRIFRTAYGMSPREWRTLCRNEKS